MKIKLNFSKMYPNKFYVYYSVQSVVVKQCNVP